jgi:outer membrane beta-barrel protein
MTTNKRNTLPIRLQLVLASLLLAMLWSTAVPAADTTATESDQVIQPEVSRRDIKIPKIKSSDFEIGVYGGILSVEYFGSSAVYGARLAYHVSEDYFVEAVYGRSTVTDEAFCNQGLCLFPQRQEDLSYYALSLGYNLFPSEIFVGQKYALNSAVYLLAGVGDTNLVNEDHFTMNFGLGIRVLPRDWLALHLTVRDYLFNSDFLGTNKLTNNFELTGGLSVYF